MLLALIHIPVKLSLGDARAYHLSTAKNELGVVSAESASGKIYFFSFSNIILVFSCPFSLYIVGLKISMKNALKYHWW